MNQPASGPAANGGGRCCGLGMYPRWWLPLNNIFHDYFSFSLPFLYTYPETARLYAEKRGSGRVFILINWEEDDGAKRTLYRSSEKREKTVGHYMSPPKLSKANLTHVP